MTYVPTAHGRVRVRGYDQARLLAKALARRRGWQYQALLSRTGSGRQVGSTRQQRFTQLETAFKLDSSRKAIEGHILLVDDVLTTGASVEAASSVLKSAGAKTIDVAVFAQP